LFKKIEVVIVATLSALGDSIIIGVYSARSLDEEVSFVIFGGIFVKGDFIKGVYIERGVED